MSSTLTRRSGPQASSASSSVGMVVAAGQLHLAQRPVRQVGDALGPPPEARQIVVVKHHHLAGGAEQDVQLHTVGTVGAGAPKRGGRVLGLARARPAVPEDQRPLPRPSRLPHTKSVPPARRRIKLEAMSPTCYPRPWPGLWPWLWRVAWEARRAARTGRARRRSGPGRALAGEATRIGAIAYEDDFLEARLVFQALPLAAPERLALRAKLLHYLLDPVVAAQARRRPARDARARERRSLRHRLRLVPRRAGALRSGRALGDAGPRDGRRDAPPAAGGGAGRSACSLRAAATSRRCWRWRRWRRWPRPSTEWQERLDQVVRWSDEESAFDEGGGGMHRAGSAIDALESALGDWPAPAVVSRLDALYVARQKRFASALHHPPAGDSARRALGELLLAHGDEMQRAVTSMAGAYLRAGRIADAAARTAPRWRATTATIPSCAACWSRRPSRTPRPADYLALARRFLPRVDFLGGTATDAPDPVVAFRVLEAGLAAHPARSGPADSLGPRRAPAVVLLPGHPTPRGGAGGPEHRTAPTRRPARELEGKISAELIELYFVRLRLRLDPERDTPAYAEADDLKRRFEEAKRRFASTEMKVRDADIDFELARSYVNAGLIDRAEPLFMRARDEGEPTAEVTVELANLALKRGDPARATRIVREGIDALRTKGASQDTIGSVEGRARLDRLLGDTLRRRRRSRRSVGRLARARSSAGSG